LECNHLHLKISKAPREGLLYEDKGNTQISGYCDGDWVGSPMIDIPLQGIVFSCEETLFLGKARNKMWLLDLVL